MKLCLLHLDDALHAQSALMQTCARHGAQHIEAKQEGADIRLWGRREQYEHLQPLLGDYFKRVNEPTLFFMGSGDFHHVSALLLEEALKKNDGQVTLIHFDNHPDWVYFDDGIHCGSWVNRALESPKLAKVLTVGVCSKDLYLPDFKGGNLSLLSQGLLELFPYSHAPSYVRCDYGSGISHTQKDNRIHWQTIESWGEQAFLEFFLTRIQTKKVYITIDKDVLTHEHAHTNWDQGMMRLPFLLQMLREIGESHHVVGADVIGDYSTPHYTGSFWTRLKKHAEIWIDQPRAKQTQANMAALNSITNHALIEVFSEIMV